MFIRKFDFFICHFLNLWSIRVWDFSPPYPTLYRPPALLIILSALRDRDMRHEEKTWPLTSLQMYMESWLGDWRHTSVTPVAWERVWDGDHQPPPCSTYSQLCRKIKQVSLIDQIHHSLSHCTVSLISVSRPSIGGGTARSQLSANRRARHEPTWFYHFALSSMSGQTITGLQDESSEHTPPPTGLCPHLPSQATGGEQWAQCGEDIVILRSVVKSVFLAWWLLLWDAQ